MLTRLRVKNFRLLRDVTIDMNDLTVLIGPNSAGKSTILEVLDFLARCASGKLEDAVVAHGGIESIRTIGVREPVVIETNWSFSTEPDPARRRDWNLEWTFSLDRAQNGAALVRHEMLFNRINEDSFRSNRSHDPGRQTVRRDRRGRRTRHRSRQPNRFGVPCTKGPRAVSRSLLPLPARCPNPRPWLGHVGAALGQARGGSLRARQPCARASPLSRPAGPRPRERALQPVDEPRERVVFPRASLAGRVPFREAHRLSRRSGGREESRLRSRTTVSPIARSMRPISRTG